MTSPSVSGAFMLKANYWCANQEAAKQVLHALATFAQHQIVIC